MALVVVSSPGAARTLAGITEPRSKMRMTLAITNLDEYTLDILVSEPARAA
jgi:hypothetical protein